MVIGADWPTLFTAVSAGAAAVAALAAWATVALEHRARSRSREPILSITVVALAGESYRERITIENEGGGLAREVMFLVVDRQTREACMGPLPPTGTLPAGRRVILAPGYSPRQGGRQEVMAAVVCRSGPNALAWNMGGAHARYRIRERLGRTVSPAAMFERLYSDAPDTDSLQLFAYHVESIEG